MNKYYTPQQVRAHSKLITKINGIEVTGTIIACSDLPLENFVLITVNDKTHQTVFSRIIGLIK